MAKHLSRNILKQMSSLMISNVKVNCPSASTTASDSTSVMLKTNISCPVVHKTCTQSARHINYAITGCPVTGAKSLSPEIPTTKTNQVLPYESLPTPKGLPLIGTLFDLIRSGGAQYTHLYCDRRHHELGPIYKETLGNVEAVFIADAALMQKVYQFEGKYPQHMVPEPWIIYNEINGIKRGLFFMDGPEWSERRKSLNKVFLKSPTISEYSDIFNSVATDFVHNWDQLFTGNNGQSSDNALVTKLEKELYNWSIESLGTMIFGRRLGCIPMPNTGASDDTQKPMTNIHEFVHCVQQIFVESANMQLIPPKLAFKLNLPVWRRFVDAAGKALNLARSYVNENVEQIKKEQTMNKQCDRMTGQGIIRELLEEGTIDHEEIVRIIVDLFIAAADTTSHATQWALYLLARNPECQQKMLDEINSVTGGQIVEESHLPQLSYIKGVIKESLRLYPVAPFLSRYMSQDLELSGYDIPSGKLVIMSLYTTGRKSEYFTNPNKFLPERWLRDKQSSNYQAINTHACLPFGLGVRSCIGRRVAEIQMQFLLSRIIQKFHLSSTADKEIGIKLRMITTPEQPIHLSIKKRNSI
ncbi:cytochrome P450 315a1, mitochondrial-like [Oppia nitens]|uniref:cytochrome P450 315a1, mitochondrial-like n=1 Tax=Oppia nitens TaxID=1686743 RepID=UPI0023D9D2CD|nr:cytochrome P450 315a1, mitochondrial-like [Oppia nitens]